jgi:energy-coupling factor transport system permease protein
MELIGYKNKDSIIHKLDARTKLILSTTLILLAFIFNHPLFLFVLFLFSICLCYIAKIHKEVFVRTFVLIPLILLSFFLWSFFYKPSSISSKTQDTVIGLGPLNATTKGLMYGLAMPFRIIVVLVSSILFLMTTKLSDFIYALKKLGLPYVWAFTFGLSTRLLSTIGNEFTTIKQAQASRGLETEKGNLVRRIKSHIPIVVPLTMKGLELSEQLGMSMSLKGFNPNNRRTFYRELKMRSVDYLVILVCLASLAISTILRINGIGVIT